MNTLRIVLWFIIIAVGAWASVNAKNDYKYAVGIIVGGFATAIIQPLVNAMLN